jgi:hypothetical protein
MSVNAVMADQTLNEIRQMLASGTAIPDTVAQRLTLSMIADMYEQAQASARMEQERHDKIEQRLQNLESTSIVLWVGRNRPIALALGTLIFIVVLTAQDVVIPMIAKAVGVTLP